MVDVSSASLERANDRWVHRTMMTTPQRPPVAHGRPLQQSASTVHACPYCEHVGGGPASAGGTTIAPLLGLPLPGVPLAVPLLGLPLLAPLVEPLDGGVPPHGPHMPWVPPAGKMHDEPRQQSAVVVHGPHALTHVSVKQTKGGIPPATALGTQGTPPQQSALDAHAWPLGTHVAGEQRGTPTLS